MSSATTPRATEVSIRLLGSFEVTLGTEPVRLPRGRQRALLAALALPAGRVVSADALGHQVWGDDPPRRVRGSLHTYVMRLRNGLGERVVRTEPDGYRLDVHPDHVDAQRFLRLVDAATTAGVAPEAELSSLTEALGLWDGEDLALGSEQLADRWRPQLTERYLTALERHARLTLATDQAAVGRLGDAVARHPLRETLWEGLIMALAAAGRGAEALVAFAECRRRLGHELGVEPGIRLRRLHGRLLEGDAHPWPGSP